jgi:hypothetical protein
LKSIEEIIKELTPIEKVTNLDIYDRYSHGAGENIPRV